MNPADLKAVLRDGQLTWEVPELYPSVGSFIADSCTGCVFDLTLASPSRAGGCRHSAPVKHCYTNRTIYIDASPEALAEYIAQRLTP